MMLLLLTEMMGNTMKQNYESETQVETNQNFGLRYILSRSDMI